MVAYYGSRISDHMTRTPEGFLICHDVPIGRTGWQEYLGQEIGIPDMHDRPVQVYRDAAQVFSPAAMASFNLKSVTDEHPPDAVRPDNYASYERGQVTNVRQGKGDESDLLLADLVIKDPRLISEVEHGKREVSCGYDCSYEPVGDGSYRQTNIRGNHVAVVATGRAGDRVAIKDSASREMLEPTVPTTMSGGSPPPPDSHGQGSRPGQERRRAMRSTTTSIWGRMLSAFAKDADPEELAQAARMAPGMKMDMAPGMEMDMDPGMEMDHHHSHHSHTSAHDQEGDEDASEVKALADAVAALTRKVDELLAAESKEPEGEQQEEPEEPEGLDALEGELEGKADKCPTCGRPLGRLAAGGEESVTIPPEEIRDGEAGPIARPEELPINPIRGADSRAVVLSALRAVKPVVAGIRDASERKRVSDALVATFRRQVSPAGAEDGYAAILRATAQASTRDAQADPLELGREWARKFNPHRKEGK